MLIMKRMFKKFLSLLQAQFPSDLQLASSHSRMRRLSYSFKTLYSYSHSFPQTQSKALIVYIYMRNFHKKRSWKKLGLLLVLARVKHSINAFCVAWHKGNYFNSI